ncbi:MAG: YqaA family protein [Chloroflexota bacterium]
MDETLFQYGYPGLFILSFVASTLVAAPSDVMAMAMPALGYDPVLIILIATAGGYLGNLVNYAVGYYGAAFVLSRWFGGGEDDDTKPDRWHKRAERLYERYGVYSLLLSGTPFVGDPLTTVAGGFRVNLWAFSVMVIVGKLAKFVLLLGAVGGVRGFFGG